GEVEGPSGASTWEVTLSARGRLPAGKDATITTVAPPDFRHQHIFDEHWRSDELLHREGRGDAGRPAAERDTLWKALPMAAGSPYGLTYSFHCVMGIHHQMHAMHERTAKLDAVPGPTDPSRRSGPRIESDDKDILALARELVGDRTVPADKVRAFYEHV